MDRCDRCNNLMEPARLENYQGKVEQCNGCGMIRIFIIKIKAHEPEFIINERMDKAFFEPLIYQAFKVPKFARGGFAGESWRPKGTIKIDNNG